MRMLLVVGCTFWISAWWTVAGDQAPSRTPPLVIDSVTGRDSFTFYCATCHGPSGKGDGPAAIALKIAPPDLTQLTRRNGGSFPRGQIAAFVTGAGRAIPAHGSGEMPVWGPIFRSLDPSDTRVKVRITNLVDYLETIQAR